MPSRVPLSVQGARSQERTLCRGHRDGTRAAWRWGLAPARWVKVERNQPGKASRPRVSSRVSSRGRSSRVARLQASRPHLPRLPAPARPAGLRREPPLRLWQPRLRGRLPGAGRGRGRRGRAGHVGGRRAGDPSRRQAGWRGARTQSRLAAAQHFPLRTLLGSQGRLGKEKGRPGPRGMPSTYLGDNLLGPGKGAQPAESRSPEDSSGDLCPNGILWRLLSHGQHELPGRARARVRRLEPQPRLPG